MMRRKDLVLLNRFTSSIQTITKLRFQNSMTNDDSFYPEDKIYSGCILHELGLELTVRDSVLGVGKGLFLALDSNEGVEEVEVSPGQILCGYSKGVFEDQARGDKTVGFSFNDLNNGVIFNKKLMTLSDAISMQIQSLQKQQQQQQQQSKRKDSPDNAKSFSRYKNIVQGHILQFTRTEDGQEAVGISADTTFKSRYFIPFDIQSDDEISISNMGMFANDMAFDSESGEYEDTELTQAINQDGLDASVDSESSILPATDDSTIVIDSEAVLYPRNLLELVWRLEANKSGVLVPTWPVVLFAGPETICFRNPQAVEIGLSYAGGYWKAYMSK